MNDDDDVIDAEPVEESIGDFIGEQFDALDIESEPVDNEIRDRADASAPQDDPETEGGVESDSQVATAPQSMSAKDREAYYASTPELQKWVSDRDREQQADYTKKTMEVAEQRKYYEDIEKVTAPRREQFALSGMNVAQGIDQLLSLSDFAQRDPLGFSRYILESRGYSLADVANQHNAGEQYPSDPQIVDLQQRLAAQENYISQQNDQQIQQEGRVVTGVINDFASTHPFYEELHDDMVPIVVSLRESKPGLRSDQYLDLAYKMAAAANDNVSSKMDVDRTAQANSARVAKAKQTAASARRAGGANIQSSGTMPPNVVHSKNVDDFIGALIDERRSA